MKLSQSKISTSNQRLVVLAALAFMLITLTLALNSVVDRESRYTKIAPEAGQLESAGPATQVFQEVESELDQVVKESNEALNFDTNLQEPLVNFEFVY